MHAERWPVALMKVAALAVGALSPMSLAMASGGGGSSEGGGEGSGSPTLVPMNEIAVPIIDAGELLGTLRFTLVLRAPDAAAAAVLASQQPRLRMAALGAGLEFARLRASPFRPIDVARLSQALDAALHTADPGVQQALIVRVIAVAED